MLLQSLEVQNFRAVRQASLTFGRGLNILFGPNDLGKSSLVDALRAAFLLPYSSAEGQKFQPWARSEKVPTVIVRFEAQHKEWRISKEFGAGARGTAILECFGENHCLLEKFTGKAVEVKIRETLGWGIPPPGQKKGLAESYLTIALLGRQDNATEILEASLGPDGSGRDLVTNALGALAQEPLVNQLLRKLEERKDEAFTPGGLWKTGGPVAKRTKEIERQKMSLEQSEERVRQSKGIEEKVASLTMKVEVVSDECSRLQRRLGLLQAARLAEENLNRIRAVEDAHLALEVAESQLVTKDRLLQDASLILQKLEEELRLARDRLAKSSGALDEVRKTADQRRDARKAQLIAKRDAATGRVLLASDAIQARNHAQSLVEALKLAKEQRESRAAQVAGGEKELNDAKAAAKEAEDMLADAQRQANRNEVLQASLAPAKIAERDALQTLSGVKAATDLSLTLENAEQSVTDISKNVRSLDERLTVNAQKKQNLEVKGPTSKPPPIQAILLALLTGGTVAAVIGVGLGLRPLLLVLALLGGGALAGGATALVLWRRNLLQANQIWRRELDNLDKKRGSLLEEKNQLTLNRGIAQVRADTLRSQRDQLNASSGKLTFDEAVRRQQVAEKEAERIEQQLAALEGSGISVERAEQAVVVRKKEVGVSEQCLNDARQEMTAAETRVGILEAQLGDAERKKAELAVKLGDVTSEQALTQAKKVQGEVELALKELEEGADSQVKSSENEVEEALLQVTRCQGMDEEARTKQRLATEARDKVRQERDDARMTCATILQSAPSVDLTTAESAIAEARRHLETDASGADLPQDVDQTNTLLGRRIQERQQAENDLLVARGELNQAGGIVAREQRDQEREALDVLEETGRALELEYQATKYLLDVLKDEEARHATHLGRCLAEPVTKILRELTNSDRYSQVVFEPQLRVQNVVAKGDEREWASLSVGTRDQLATIIRLVLAAQLKTVVVFDDQLTQSDHHRLKWFKGRLRASVRDHDHQVIVITCRPLDYVSQDELPVPPSNRFEADEGRLVVIDLAASDI